MFSAWTKQIRRYPKQHSIYIFLGEICLKTEDPLYCNLPYSDKQTNSSNEISNPNENSSEADHGDDQIQDVLENNEIVKAMPALIRDDDSNR